MPSRQTFNEFTFRPDQEKARDMVTDSLHRGKKRPMLQAPCAWGKTIFASGLFSGALGKRKKAMFVVASKSLIDQTHDKFHRAGICDVGIIQADHPLTNFDAPIQIASAQTLERRKIPMVDFVMIDEAHMRRESYRRWMADPDWAKIPFVGLSGTPWSEGLASDFDDLLIPTTSKVMLEQGLLSQYRLLAPTLKDSRPDLKKIATQATPYGHDYAKAPLSKRMRTKKLVCGAVETWLAKGEDRPTLVFCVDRAHAKDVEEEYRNAGISTAYVDKDTDRDVRKNIGERFNAGEIRVVVSIATLIVGVDWDVRCIQWLRPTKSEILWVQGNARAFRLAEGKDDALILDHSWNTNNLGNPTDIHYDFLDDGTPSTAEKAQRKKQERKELFPDECLRCGYYKQAGVSKCPDCGFEVRKRGNVEYLQGELVEVRHNPAKEKSDHNTKQLWYSQLLWVQDQRRYSDGWTANTYRRRFEVWPRGLSKIRTPASAEVLNFVKAGIMEYHRSQKLRLAV
jgi:DNA repair protein RadD